MSSKRTHVLALLAGVTLTVGFYEGRRLAYNTYKAITVAQSQITGRENVNPRRQALLEAVDKDNGRLAASPKGAAGSAPQRPHTAQKPVQRPAGTPTTAAGPRANMSAARLRMLQEMSPEERRAFRERRRTRRAEPVGNGKKVMGPDGQVEDLRPERFRKPDPVPDELAPDEQAPDALAPDALAPAGEAQDTAL